MGESIRCRCGSSNSKMCRQCSKVRMVIMLKNGNDKLKLRHGTKLNNPVWYSYLKYNRYELSRIAEKMEARLRMHKVYGSAAQVLLFYRNGDRGSHFKKVTL